MKDKTKNKIYSLLNPNRLLYVKENHVTEEELTNIYNIMSMITKNDKYYYEINKFHHKDGISFYNDTIFRELCKLEDKRYLYIVTPELIGDITIHEQAIFELPKRIVDSIRYYTNYKKLGNQMYENIGFYLYRLFNDEVRSAATELTTVLAMSFNEAYYDANYKYKDNRHYHLTYRALLLILSGYLYVNRHLIEKDKLLYNKIIGIMTEDSFFESMIVNGAFTDDANPDVYIYFIEQALEIIKESEKTLKR